LQTADALLTTHIRYQGFQGNIRATTAPVSFDPQALTTLMALPEFAQWRQNGGIIVSDALGVRSVERFYDVTEQSFPHRRIARDAFFAGNDLLYLGDYALGDAPYEEQLANIKNTILWFQQLYETDPSFQGRNNFRPATRSWRSANLQSTSPIAACGATGKTFTSPAQNSTFLPFWP
jgi:beta-N-acetylhexosaminidase